MPKHSKWYKSWFDSPYYPVLYAHRNYREAIFFMDHLLNYLQPEPGAEILDLACGRGRHSRYLCEKGYQVTGVDLSSKNIMEASKIQCGSLEFHVHDMRKLFKKGYFPYIFNFFTSFGYFDNEPDNLKTLKAIYDGLKDEGTCVIDFLNVKKEVYQLKHEEDISMSDIDFHITKSYKNNAIEKIIQFMDKGQSYTFQEYIQALELPHFQKYFKKCGFILREVFGDYELNEFDDLTSDRLIMIAVKSQ